MFTKYKFPDVPVEISRNLNTRPCALLDWHVDLTLLPFPIESYWTFYFEEATRQPANGLSRGDHFGVTMWPRLVGGLWREVNYTVSRLMHRECGRRAYMPRAVGEGPYKRGTSVCFQTTNGAYRSFALCTRYPECMFTPTSNMCECLERTRFLSPWAYI